MRKLAAFIMQGRLRAVTATAGFGAGGLLLPPLALLSSSAIALVTLRLGGLQGLTVATLSAVVIALMAWVAGLGPAVGLVTALVQWLPAVALAQVLRSTVSWSAVLLTAVLMGCGAVILLQVLVPGIDRLWLAVLEQTAGPLFEPSGQGGAAREEAFQQAATLMSGMVAAVSVLALILGLLLARYWQSQLYNPGGFRREFQALRVGPGLAAAVTGLLLLAWWTGATLWFELALVCLMAFFMHGVALLHGLNARLGLHRLWLVALYVLMALALPQMMVMLATLGIVDSVLDLRGRLPDRARPDDT
ncbi:MAG: DUF2232 domain-containing protein [Ectothiorhodospira sp.]